VLLNGIGVTAAFSPASSLPLSQRGHVRADYRRFDWNAHAAWNSADFYDLSGPTPTSPRGYDLGVGHTSLLLFDEPRRLTFDVDGRVAGHLDQLPENQNVAARVGGCYSRGRASSYR